MKDILIEIAANKRCEIEALYRTAFKRKEIIKNALEADHKPVSLRESIQLNNRRGKVGIIGEFKRRSPSKGDIAPMAAVTDIISQYQTGGAAGCSILTDTRYFGGALSDLAVARRITDLPLLRKDFVVDEIQIYEARMLGADVILLIAALLSGTQIKSYVETAHSLGLEVLLEIHNENEIEKIDIEADMIGVNNRSLSTFHTDVNHSVSFPELLPAGSVKIAESGISTPADVERLYAAGFNGFLIGESLMRSSDIKETLNTFRDAPH